MCVWKWCYFDRLWVGRSYLRSESFSSATKKKEKKKKNQAKGWKTSCSSCIYVFSPPHFLLCFLVPPLRRADWLQPLIVRLIEHTCALLTSKSPAPSLAFSTAQFLSWQFSSLSNRKEFKGFIVDVVNGLAKRSSAEKKNPLARWLHVVGYKSQHWKNTLHSVIFYVLSPFYVLGDKKKKKITPPKKKRNKKFEGNFVCVVSPLLCSEGLVVKFQIESNFSPAAATRAKMSRALL